MNILNSCLFSCSGGHFNPAVTLGVFIAGDIHYMLALGYFVSQILGGLIGAGFTRVSIFKRKIL